MAEVEGPQTARFLLKKLRVRHVGLGFFWACGMLTFRTSNLFANVDDIALVSTVLLLCSFGFNIVTMLALAWAEHRRPGFVEALPGWIFCVLALAGIAALQVSCMNPNVDRTLFLCGCIMTGISYGYLRVGWAQAYARMHPDITELALPAAFVLTIVLHFACSVLVDLLNIPAVVAMAPLPFISMACLVRCRKAPDYHPAPKRPGSMMEAITSLSDILVASAVFSFLFGFLWESSVLTLSSVNDTHRIPLFITLIAALALFFITLFGRRTWNISLVYTYGAPIIAVSLALFPIAFSANPILVNSVMDGGFTVMEIVVWVAVATLSFDDRVEGAITGAITRSVFLLFRLIGIVVAYFLMAFAPGSTAVSSFIAIAAIAVIAYWAWSMHGRSTSEADPASDPKSEPMVVIPKQTVAAHAKEQPIQASDEPAAETDRPNRPRFRKMCQAVCDEYGLSRRESEILPYLAQGRSAPYIADTLYISESTVRTHIKHILEKTGAPSKQSLIDFVRTRGTQLLEAEEC